MTSNRPSAERDEARDDEEATLSSAEMLRRARQDLASVDMVRKAREEWEKPSQPTLATEAMRRPRSTRAPRPMDRRPSTPIETARPAVTSPAPRPDAGAAFPPSGSPRPSPQPAPEPVGGERRRGPSGLRRLISIGVAVAIAIAVLNSFTAISETETRMPIETLPPETCFHQSDAEVTAGVEVVPCEEPHDFELIGHVTLDAGPFPGDDAAYRAAVDRCVPFFETYVGTAYAESIWWLTAFTPTEAAWDGGDRRSSCVVFQLTPDDEILPVTGSARSDGR